MRFDKSKDPAACVAKSPSRYAVQGVAIVEHGPGLFLAATDGHCLTLVRAHAEDGDDVSAALGNGRVYPPAAFAAAREGAKRKPDASLVLNGSAHVEGDGAHAEYQRVQGTFPDVPTAIPKGPAKLVLRLNAEYLARMQKALGADGVEIVVHALGSDGEIDPQVPLTIRPIHVAGPGTDDGSFGVLMPIGGD